MCNLAKDKIIKVVKNYFNQEYNKAFRKSKKKKNTASTNSYSGKTFFTAGFEQGMASRK